MIPHEKLFAIFKGALQPAVPADVDMMQLIEMANTLNRLIMDYAKAQQNDNAPEMASLLKKIHKIGKQLANLGNGAGKSP